ncbi:ABC transporter permease [Sphingomonas glaciei]|uniref:ABC transporter permease n=1 Tax=Sphingomonas glaciei TaxID=2938948 RepID=A0ABY5MRC5_9SPHN|nr:ABC transporter permease [Sphingomonas glaciei]UUR07030.1 ABC transporter permease [Sphingomonas glaciei]
MSNVLLVALREYRQITRMRSFWLTLLILPVALAIAPLTQRFMGQDEADKVMIVDQSSIGAGKQIADRLRLDEDRRAMNDLARYVQRHKLAAPADAPWARNDRYFSDAEVELFGARGGVTAALSRLKPSIPPETAEFEIPDPRFEIVTPPDDLARLQSPALEQRMETLLRPEEGSRADPIDAIVVIPADFTRTGTARFSSSGRPNAQLLGSVQDVLTRSLRQGLLAQEGVPLEVAAAAATVTPNLLIAQPAPGSGVREALLVRSILPLASCYLLMMALMLSGSWMLQGTIEERSNKLLETVLATISPEQLMYGKLLGTVAVGLTMIGVWIACGAFAAFATQGAIAEFIRPALAPLNSPITIAAMIYFFIAGYLAISVFFLAVGAISDSMNDAQGYLMPIILAILLPITILIQGIVDGGKGIGVTIMTWVPIWTPFAVLARLGTGIQTWEVIGSGLLLAAFVALQMLMLGRLFRASLLASGQKPGVKELAARLRGRTAHAD